MSAAPSSTRIRLDPRSRAMVLIAGAACVAPLLLRLEPKLAAGIAVAGFAVALGAWRRPLPAWLRILLALGLAGAVFATMGVNFGRDTGCAMLAAMLAVKPAETDSLRDARSLLGFALFAPFATFLLDQGPLSLALGLVAVVLRADRAAAPGGPGIGRTVRPNALVETLGEHRAHDRARLAAGVGGVLAVPAPGHAAVGRARSRDVAPGPGRQHVAGPVGRHDDRRHARRARALLRAHAAAGRDVFARAGVQRIRWPHLVARAMVRIVSARGRASTRAPSGTTSVDGADRPPATRRARRAAVGTGQRVLRRRPRLARGQSAGLGDALAHALGQRRALRRCDAGAVPARTQPATAGRLQSAHRRAGAAMAAGRGQRRRGDRPPRTRLDPSRLRLHAGVLARGAQRGRRVPVRRQAWLLRTVQFVVRRADARGGHSGARGRRLCGRGVQPDRRLLDRAPLRCARLGRSLVRRPRLGARGSHRRGGARTRVRHARRSRAPAGDLLASLQPMWNVGDWMLRGWNDSCSASTPSANAPVPSLRPGRHRHRDAVDAVLAGRVDLAWPRRCGC